MTRQLTAIVIGTVGVVFFVALTLYSYRQGARERGYLTGLLLIIFVCLNTLIRGLFYPGASPDPSTLSGMWRLANGGIGAGRWTSIGARVAPAAEGGPERRRVMVEELVLVFMDLLKLSTSGLRSVTRHFTVDGTCQINTYGDDAINFLRRRAEALFD